MSQALASRSRTSPQPGEVDRCQEMAEVCGLLANWGRAKILEHLLAHGPAASGALGRLAQLSPSAASVHLKILENGGLVTSERKSQTIEYRARPERLKELRANLAKVLG